MATINKLGAKSYLASSKNVNRVLTQLNGVLASGNITVAPTVTMGTTNTATVDLSAGNFISLTTNTSSVGNTITLTNIMPGVYDFKVTSGIANATLTINNSYPSTANTLTATSGKTDLLTYISDGTNLWQVNKINVI